MKHSWRSEIAMWLLLAGMFTLAAVTWRDVPEPIPVHWNLQCEVNLNSRMPLLMGARFIVNGSLLGRVRPNWFVGIRTPWTLSSRDAWVRAHRAGG